MSEKQFKLSSETVLQYQIMDNDTDLNENEVVDLLNSQSKLISAYMYEFAKMSKENKKLKERNEQLKQGINSLFNMINGNECFRNIDCFKIANTLKNLIEK